MFDHVSLAVTDLQVSRRFYDAALATLGISMLFDIPGEGLGYGANGRPQFWINQSARPLVTHVAFEAADRAAVEAFHAAGLAAGGQCNGPPGLRPHYDPDYYAAFVLDPDGANVEAVCRSKPL